MATSTIPTVKANTLTRLQADAGLSGVQVSWGHPYPARMGSEVVIIGKATNEQDPSGLGTDGREERYTIEIVVSVVGPARHTQQSLEERAFVIAGVIENSIIAWRTAASVFGGLNGWILVSGISSGEGITEDGAEREAVVTITLSVVARI